ncbi:carbon-nitrogen hydrolase family protein [Pikeienuella sp. HZG-20]|uniref:carbon-nitrogen hydrolase family protein n=1 Tax=Paludibacillus litoralis TaxID=3133267 RepID=UPI0030EEA004
MTDPEMKLAIVQMNSTDDLKDNLAKAEAFVAEAATKHGARLVVLPEFFNIPYVFQYRDYAHIDRAEPADGPTITLMRKLAAAHKVAIVATIFEEEAAGLCYDTAYFIEARGEIVGKYRKTHPAAVQSLEKIYFRHGSHFPVFKLQGMKVGAIICYDTLFPETARCVALNGAEVVVVPFAAPELPAWKPIMITRAFENGVWFAPTNKVGAEGEWTFGGRSMIVDPTGAVAAEFDDREEGVRSTLITRRAVVEARRVKPMFRDRRPDLYSSITTQTEDIKAYV